MMINKIVKIGITEQGDPVFDLKWLPWVKKGNPAILITKSPFVLYKMVKDLEDINIIVHCTITGNGGTVIEPKVPNYEESLDGLVKFVELLGKERVVLRIDPIIPHKDFFKNSEIVLNRAKELLGENMCRVRISFYDNYKHAEERLNLAGVEFNHKSFDLPIDVRRKIWNSYGCPDICGESGMKSTPCLSEIDCRILGVEPGVRSGYQRYSCDCLSNKVELLKRTGSQCNHQCSYCYLKGDFKDKKSII